MDHGQSYVMRTGLVSISSPPSFYWHWRLFHQRFRTLHWALLVFFRLAWALSSSQLWTLWMASPPSRISTPLLSLVSPAALLRVHSTPCLCSWWRYQVGMVAVRTPGTHPLYCCFYLDTEPLTVTLDMVSQFLIRLKIHPSNSYLSSLEVRMLWGTVSGLTELYADDIPCPLTLSLCHRIGQQISQDTYSLGWVYDFSFFFSEDITVVCGRLSYSTSLWNLRSK